MAHASRWLLSRNLDGVGVLVWVPGPVRVNVRA
jgi:hypothetical protein